MTARIRSRLRYASMFTLATLVAITLGFVMVRGAYDRAYADGAAAVATSPLTVHDPVTDPGAYGEDVLTAFRAGEWSALALVLLIGGFAAVNAIADRRRSEWLARLSPLVAGAAAVVATMLVFLASQHWLDMRVLGTVSMAVALAVARMPGHRIPTGLPQAGIATSPRPGEAGCARLHLVIGIGLAVLLTVPFWAACDTRATIQHAKQEIIDCGRAEVADLAADLAPAVGAILTGDTPSWRAQLDALLSAGTHAGACAIKAVGRELAARAAAVVTGAHVEGQEATGAAHAREYLAARGFVFEVAQ
jgi:hypothetical protein